MLCSINALIAMAVPDVPPEVEIQLDRQDYLRGKILDNIEVGVAFCLFDRIVNLLLQDEDEEGLKKGLSTKADYFVQ